MRSRTIPPFSHAARLLRRATDPLIDPIEHRLLKSGGNPVNAPWWLFGTGLVGAIVLVTVADWLSITIARAGYAAGAGPAALVWFAIRGAVQLVVLALIVRVFGSWFGMGRYNRWMRPTYVVTDWLVEPLRRVVPPFGAFDITPLVAWMLLQLVLRFLPS